MLYLFYNVNIKNKGDEYMSCDTEEKEVFKEQLETLQNIPKVNII